MRLAEHADSPGLWAQTDQSMIYTVKNERQGNWDEYSAYG